MNGLSIIKMGEAQRVDKGVGTWLTNFNLPQYPYWHILYGAGLMIASVENSNEWSVTVDTRTPSVPATIWVPVAKSWTPVDHGVDSEEPYQLFYQAAPNEQGSIYHFIVLKESAIQLATGKVDERLGIGIVTHNQLDTLQRCVAAVKKYTRSPYHLIIADDGSTDGTVEWCQREGLAIITGKYRGIAWNKNRALYWLQQMSCDPVLLLRDDCHPAKEGWERSWVHGAHRWQHVDYGPTPVVEEERHRVSGQPDDPFTCTTSYDWCTITTRGALDRVGFLNVGLVNSGLEHVEWTRRFCKVFGRVWNLPPDTVPCLSSGLTLTEPKTTSNKQNGDYKECIDKSIENAPIYQAAWCTEDEHTDLELEIAACKAILPKIAPLQTADCSPRWEGRIAKKPWDYEVSAIIPHLETPELLHPVIELLRLQTERPYIMVIDTGSSRETMDQIECLRAEDVEIHYIRGHAYLHPSEAVAVAQDLAFALCRSKYLFCTHADCFLRRRTYIEGLMMFCNQVYPAVGYEMSPRDWLTDQWQGMISHTATLLHMPTMHQLGVTWSFDRGHYEFGMSRSTQSWPDTETCMNLVLRQAGVKPLLIGAETNFERFTDKYVDHCRSYPGSLLYANEYHQKMQTSVNAALREAWLRIALWRQETAVACSEISSPSSHSSGVF